MNKATIGFWVSALVLSGVAVGCGGEVVSDATSSAEATPVDTRSEAVIGGADVSSKEFQDKFPWMASVYSFDDPDPTTPNFSCGGVVIGDRWVLTAAHCVAAFRDLYLSRSMAVGVRNTVEGKTKKIAVDAAYYHPVWVQLTSQYSPDPLPPSEKAQGDLALVHLAQSAGVERAPFIDNVFEEFLLASPGRNATFLGWGDTTPSYEYNPPDKLQQVSLRISDRAACKKLDPNLDASELCAIVGSEGRDTCFGDSGGPIAVKGPGGKFVVAGLLSWGGENQGKDCGVPTAVNGFARLATLGPWVKQCLANRSRCGANAVPFPNADGSLSAPAAVAAP